MNDPIILVDQPTAAPTRKVMAAGMAGAAATLIAWAANQFAGITFPAGIEGALVVLFSGLIAYFTRDQAQPPVTSVDNPRKEQTP